jgi:hypothetical protein
MTPVHKVLLIIATLFLATLWSAGAFAQFAASPEAVITTQPPGMLRLAIFGWLEPYAVAIVQGLIGLGFAWFAKSRYSTLLDESSRDALETFLKNRASSLIADGAVRMQGLSINVNSAALAREVELANKLIPGALKRFGLLPSVIADKIIDAIPQTTTGALIIAKAHGVGSPPQPVASG